MRINEYLELEFREGKPFIVCTKCRHALCGADDNYKLHCLMDETEPSKLLPDVYPEPSQFVDTKIVFRRFCCPRCYRLVDTEVAIQGSPILWDVQLKVP